MLRLLSRVVFFLLVAAVGAVFGTTTSAAVCTGGPQTAGAGSTVYLSIERDGIDTGCNLSSTQPTMRTKALVLTVFSFHSSVGFIAIPNLGSLPIPNSCSMSVSAGSPVSPGYDTNLCASGPTIIYYDDTPSFTFSGAVTKSGAWGDNPIAISMSLTRSSNDVIVTSASIDVQKPDTSAPAVQSISVNGSPAADATSVDFVVSFDENANNISVDDFALIATGSSAGTISSVNASSGSSVTVTVSDISGNGSIRLDLKGATNIADDAGNTPPAAYSNGSTHTTLFDTTGPAVTITGVPESYSDRTPFTVTYTFDENVVGFSLTDVTEALVNATASSLATGIANTVFTVLIMPTGNGDVSVGLKANAVQDAAGNNNLNATPVVATSSIIQETQGQISTFLQSRNSALLNIQPDITRFIDNSFASLGGPLGALRFSANDNGINSLTFATSLGHIWSTMDRNAAKHQQGAPHAFGYAAPSEESAPAQSPAQRRGFDIWGQLHGARNNANDSETTVWAGYLGAHYFVNPNLLVGAMAQVDWAEQSNDRHGTSTDGLGWMAGPYVAAKHPGFDLYFDARAAWGQSDNDISAKVATGSFETDRWLVSATISGKMRKDRWMISPAVSLFYFEEVQNASTDSLSNVIGAQTFSQGELRFGPKISYGLDLENGWTVIPSFAAKGLWSFASEIGSSQKGIINDGDLRARLDAGFDIRRVDGIKFQLDGFYDGIGQTNYETYGGKARLIIPIN